MKKKSIIISSFIFVITSICTAASPATIGCPVDQIGYQLPTACSARFMQTEGRNELEKINNYFREKNLEAMHQDQVNHPEFINQKSARFHSEHFFCLQKFCREGYNACLDAKDKKGNILIRNHQTALAQRTWCLDRADAIIELMDFEITHISIQNQAQKELSLYEEKHRAISTRFRDFFQVLFVNLVAQIDRFETRVNYFIENPIRK